MNYLSHMFEVVLFPIYGVAVGVNYWQSNFDEWPDWLEDVETPDREQHMLQIFCLLFGISVIWYR